MGIAEWLATPTTQVLVRWNGVVVAMMPVSLMCTVLGLLGVVFVAGVVLLRLGRREYNG